MATQGLWNVGGINIPDFGVSEWLSGLSETSSSAGGLLGGLIPNNANVYNTSPGFEITANYGLTPTEQEQQNMAATSTGPYPPSSPTNTQPQSYTGSTLGTQTENTGTGGGEDLTAQLDAIFNPALASIQGQENTLNQQLGYAETNVANEADLATQSVTAEKEAGLRDIQNTEKQAGVQKEDALTSATRLYNELQRGGQQRFGGASSAGEAFRTLTAVEQQRRAAGIENNFQTVMQKVADFKANLQEKFMLAIKEIGIQKTQALTQIYSDFRNSMDQLNAARNQIASDRATASLNLLQDLRNKVYTINADALNFTRQLALNHDASLKQVETATQNFRQQTQNSLTALQSSPLTNYQTSTQYGVNPIQSTGTTTPTGQIASSGKTWDELTGTYV